MARKATHTSVIQMDAHAISLLRCKLGGKTPTDVAYLRKTGDLPELEAQIEALKSFMDEHALGQDQLYLVLPRYDVTTRLLTLPSQDASEIAGMVRFSAEEFVPYSLDEIIIDQCVLKHLGNGESLILAALAHHDVVDRALTLFAGAGVRPEKILLSTACIAAARAGSAEDTDERHAIVNLTSGGIEIAVFDKTTPVFTRGIATQQDWEEIARNPDADTGTGLLDTSGAEELATELRSSLAAYRRESPDGLGVNRIYVACAYTKVDALCASLSTRTAKECVPADFACSYLGNVDLPGIPLELIGALMQAQNTAVGVNLLPLREAEARRLASGKRLALRVAACLALILLFLGAMYFQMLYQRTQYAQELERRIALIEPNARGITEKREALNILRRQVDRQGSIVEQAAHIVEAAPDERVNFARLVLRREEGANVWGRAKAVEDVALFAQNIRSKAENHLLFFSRARSLYEQQTAERDQTVYSFHVEVSSLEDE